MLSTKKAIILFAVIFLVQSKFELCFDLNPADLNNLHQAACKVATTTAETTTTTGKNLSIWILMSNAYNRNTGSHQRWNNNYRRRH